MTETLSTLIQTLQDLKVANINIVSATALLAYDVIITSGQEVEHIWRTPWSLVKVPYVLARYYALIFMLINSFVNTRKFLPLKFCDQFLHLELWSTPLFILMIDILIITRIYALYGRNIRMVFFLISLWLVEATSVVVLLTFAFMPVKGPAESVMPGILPSCISSHPPNYRLTLIFWAITSFFQAIFVLITVLRFRGFIHSRGLSITPLLLVILRDGVGYFLIILSVNLLNILVEIFGPLSFQVIGDSWLMTITSITACRLVLNVRDVATSHRAICTRSNTAPTSFLVV